MLNSTCRLTASIFALAILSACAGKAIESAAPYSAERAVTKSMGGSYVAQRWRSGTAPPDRENYATIESNPVVSVREKPVSSFSVDVADPLAVRQVLTSLAELGYDHRYWLLDQRGHEALGFIYDCETEPTK